MAIWIILAIIVILIIWLAGSYNGFIKLRNNTEEAFSAMDVSLKKRYDLIPNYVETVKGYAKHESQTLEKVISHTRYKLPSAELEAFNSEVDHWLAELTMNKLYDRVPASVWKYVI